MEGGGGVGEEEGGSDNMSKDIRVEVSAPLSEEGNSLCYESIRCESS